MWAPSTYDSDTTCSCPSHVTPCLLHAAHSTNAAQAALAALSSNLPGGNVTRGSVHPPPPTHYDDPATHASVQAERHPEALQSSLQQQQHNPLSLSPAGPAAAQSSESVSGASDSAESGTPRGAGQRVAVRPDQSEVSSANSNLASLQVVTELSVNIDAEEGAEILKEMSELSLLESLMVDSTDEFR